MEVDLRTPEFASLSSNADSRRVRPLMTLVGNDARDPVADSRAWWNRAAHEDASWYIATASDPFFERGRRDTDELIAFCGLQPSTDKTLLGSPTVRSTTSSPTSPCSTSQRVRRSLAT